MELQGQQGRVIEIDRLHPHCGCQEFSISKHSPGALTAGEVLLRIVISPQHVKKGKPKAAVLSHAETQGLSVFRDNFASDAEILHVATQLVNGARQNQPNPEKVGVFGVISMTVGAIRSLVGPNESEPGFCVYDTGKIDIPSHAEAFQRMNGVPEGVPGQRRTALFTLVQSGFVPVTSFRNGLLSNLAPSVI